MIAYQNDVEELVKKMAAMVAESRGPLEKSQLSSFAKQLASGVENLLVATRQVRQVSECNFFAH